MPLTLPFGLAIIIACEVMLFIDVARRGGLVAPLLAGQFMPPPDGLLGWAARWVAVNMTVFCWIGYLFVFDGLLTWLARRRDDRRITSIRARPNRFVIAWLTSIPVWCFFDWVNFYYMDAWRYHGLPLTFSDRLVGYFIAFAAISPGMFMAAHWFSTIWPRAEMGAMNRRTSRLVWWLVLGPPGAIAVWLLLLLPGEPAPWSEPTGVVATALILLLPGILAAVWKRCPYFTSAAIGLGWVTWTFLAASPLSNMTLWVGLIYLLDPINHHLGGPSLVADWRAGRVMRTLSLFAGGALCGLLWEFWNYWALAKWTYHLPFLGRFEQYRYFEMPLLGFLGFLPFAAECWVMLNTILLLLERLGLRSAEPLPSNEAVF